MTATITVDTGKLKRAVAWAAPPKSEIPVLGNVRVMIAAGQLVVASYDWETCRLARVPTQAGTAEGNGAVLVPWKNLMAAVNANGKMPAVDVRIDGTRIDLNSTGTRQLTRVSVEQVDDPAGYPAMPKPPAPAGMCKDSGALAAALTQLAGCCSEDGTLPAIGAVNFIPGDGVLELQATNRYVLGVTQVPFTANGQAEHAREWLIPGPLAAEFAAAHDGGPVFIGGPPPDWAPPAGLAMLSSAWHTLVTKPVWGDYPRVRTLMAKPRPEKATVTAAAGQPPTTKDPGTGLHAVLAEAAVLCGQVCKDKLAALLADEDDQRKPADKKAHVAARHGHGTFLDAGPAGLEVICTDPFTRQVLDRWEVEDAEVTGDAVVQLDPQHLARILPPGTTARIDLSSPTIAAGVTVPGTSWEAMIMPIRAEVTPDRKLNAREEVTV